MLQFGPTPANTSSGSEFQLMSFRKGSLVFRRLTAFAIGLCFFSGAFLARSARAQNPKTTPVQDPKTTPAQDPKATRAQDPRAQDSKSFTAEQIAEGVILIAGNGLGRVVLTQIRRNGVERGKLTRILEDGRSEEVRYELRFIRGDNSEKDKVRIDNKTAQAEYSLIYGEGRLFGIINGSPFTPRAEASAEFISQQAHSIDALLRYKENESKLTSAGKDKHSGVDVYAIDLVDKANRKTRYFISAKSFRVLWLEYEETPPGGVAAIKYTKRFYDYRTAQNTQVPYRTVLWEDGKQTLETRIMTVTYGVRMEDSLFRNPEAASAAISPQ
jgi:hypothetical protein